ncbi:MAG: hypothetical protein EOO16_08475 [Chitinophagaceae bacterium]|nr:MAG: hypothetical protein EOO16_08475 [Chitinophagaceae bacterium]
MRFFSYLIMAAGLLLPLLAPAQQADATAELNKIRAYYGGSDYKHVTGVMTLKDPAAGTTLDRVEFEYWMQGTQVFSRMNYIEILSNRTFYLMSNSRSKTIHLRRQEAVGARASGGLLDAGQLGQLLAQNGARVRLEETGKERRLLITELKASKFSSVTISYSPVDHHIIGMEALVRAQPGTKGQLVFEMRYLTSERKADGDASVFSESRYLVSTGGGKYQFTKAYQGYKKL